MVSRTKRELRAAEDLIAEHANEAKAIIDAAEAENRQRTDEENEKVADLQKAMNVAKDNMRELEDQLKVEESIVKASEGVSLDSVTVGETHEPAPEFKTLGEQFVESDGYKSVIEKGLGGSFSTGEIQLDAKGTLTTTPGTALTPPVWQPGITEKLFEPLTVADLLPTTFTSAPIIKYVKEKLAESGANTVKEAESKPESKIEFEEAEAPVRKLATVLPVSEEMLEDASQIQGYINSRLSLFIRIKEEEQLLRGNGTNPNIQGIIGASGVNTISTSGTAGTAITESIFTVLNNTRGSSLLSPDTLIIHPAQFEAMRLSKDGQGQYYGGGPFMGPYGNGIESTPNRFTSFDYWGVRTLVTSAVGKGTALVGNFSQAAHLYRRSGLTVDASNSHAENFVKNLVTIRAEQREALAIIRPSAFTTITFT